MSGENTSVLVRHEMFHFCVFIPNIMQLMQASQVPCIDSQNYRGSRSCLNGFINQLGLEKSKQVACKQK